MEHNNNYKNPHYYGKVQGYIAIHDPLRPHFLRKYDEIYYQNCHSEYKKLSLTAKLSTLDPIHIRKAEHLTIPKIRLKVNFQHPMKRQIF